MNPAEHWDRIYAARSAVEMSWYQSRPATALMLMAKLGMHKEDAIIDVGGGTSNLVDHLLEEGFRHLTVIDLSATAIATVQARLGNRAGQVNWIVADVTGAALPGPFRLWHDRAVFHFLTEPHQRARYMATLRNSLPEGGKVIMATFADDGPIQCSRLPVCRYSPDQLAAELGDGFELMAAHRETHMTPAQIRQTFIYCCFLRN